MSRMSEISNNSNKAVSVNCKKARLLILPYITNDADITTDEHRAFEQHLQSCAQCIKEYEESKPVVDLVKKYCPVGENSLSFSFIMFSTLDLSKSLFSTILLTISSRFPYTKTPTSTQGLKTFPFRKFHIFRQDCFPTRMF